MAKLKIHQLLESLEEGEAELLTHFLVSPLHGNSQLYARMLEICLVHPQAGHELIWEKLYPDKPFKSGYLRRLLAGLNDHALDFFALQQLKKDQGRKLILRLQALAQREASPSYKTALNAAEKFHQQNPFDTEFLFQLCQLRDQLGDSQETPRFQKTLEALDLHFTHLSHRYHCLATNTDFLRGTQHKYPVLPQLALANLPLLPRLYALLKSYMQHPDESQSLEAARDLMVQPDFSNVPFAEAQDLFFLCTNLYIHRMNRGEAVSDELKELYTFAIESELLLDKGRLLPRHLKNITVLMARCGEYDWAEKFIFDYGHLLLENPNGLYSDYNQAVLAFFRKQHEKSLQLFQQVRLNPAAHKDIFYGLDARGFQAMCLFETEQWEELILALNGMQVFVHRTDRLPNRRKKGYRQFTNELSRIVRASTGNPDRKRDRLKKIRADLLAHPEIAYRRWLIGLTD